MIVLLQCFALYLLVALAKANTEKTIFLAPDKIALPNSGPSLANLNLLELSSRRSALHTSLDVAFANVTNPKGLRSWYILHDLEEHQRYELRICWPATVGPFTVHSRSDSGAALLTASSATIAVLD